uniref:Uncharacterized protein n=1 Tax=Romanomermis culicivorax TaxID=13658 RepID=A0A915J3J4_ROMCU
MSTSRQISQCFFSKKRWSSSWPLFSYTGNPVTPPPKNASVQLKSVTVEIQHENSDDESKILESKDNGNDNNENKKEISRIEKVELLKISKNTTSTTTKIRKANGATVKPSTTKSPFAAKATTTITTRKFLTTTTKRRRFRVKCRTKMLCKLQCHARFSSQGFTPSPTNP